MDRLLRALDHIEARLREPLTVADAAAAAGLSLHHFCRLFRRVTGRTVKGYVRARRLTEAAMRLADGHGGRLIDLAFDSGFESQEAFTRAFKRRFGVTPAAFRRGAGPVRKTYCRRITFESLSSLMEVEPMEPRFVDSPQFMVTGLRLSVTPRRTREIPALWQRFMHACPRIADAVNGNAVGLSLAGTGDEPDGFDYMAGVEVRGDAPVPEALERVTVPAAHYAVFTHRIRDHDLSEDLKRSYAFIFEKWLPGSAYELADAADFEYYEAGRFDPAASAGEIDIYVPVRTKTRTRDG